MTDKTVLAGFGLVALTLLIVAVFSFGGSNDALTEELVLEVEAKTAVLSLLEERLAAAETALSNLAETTVETEEINDIVQSVEAQKADLQDSVAGMASEFGALDTQVSDLQAQVAALESRLAAAAAPAAVEPSPAEVSSASTAATPAPAPSFEGEHYGVGETLSLSDGALRIFVSRLLPTQVRVFRNGEREMLDVGQSRVFAAGDDYCRVTLAAITDAGAALSSLCGAALPPPEGLQVGQTSILEDGAIRVFVSRITENQARLAINGELLSLTIGRSAPVALAEQSCRVALDQIDRGHVGVSAICGAAIAVSEAAGPGSTIALADGAVRVFVSAITGEEVRFSVNGLNLSSGGAGHDVDVAEGCAVTVEEVREGKASFSYGCAN